MTMRTALNAFRNKCTSRTTRITVWGEVESKMKRMVVLLPARNNKPIGICFPLDPQPIIWCGKLNSLTIEGLILIMPLCQMKTWKIPLCSALLVASSSILKRIRRISNTKWCKESTRKVPLWRASWASSTNLNWKLTMRLENTNCSWNLKLKPTIRVCCRRVTWWQTRVTSQRCWKEVRVGRARSSQNQLKDLACWKQPMRDWPSWRWCIQSCKNSKMLPKFHTHKISEVLKRKKEIHEKGIF